MPILLDAQPESGDAPVRLKVLWAEYVVSRVQAGFMRDKGKRQNAVIDDLRRYLKHDDAARISKKDLLAWRGHLLEQRGLSAKTVSDIYLSAVRSLLSWAVENDRLTENVAATVRQPKARKEYSRDRGFTVEEALAIIRASRTYQPNPDRFGRTRESERMTQAKRWVPMICAFTGARVSEIIQLRKEDIRMVDGRLIFRITPDAGTVKAGGYRDVPIHRQIIAEGFENFVARAESGPLFHVATDVAKYGRASMTVSNKLGDWLRGTKLIPQGLQPNHAWRHRFKTQCRELGISDRVVDAIQGHAGKTAGDSYGDVNLKTRVTAVDQLPIYNRPTRN